MDLYMMHWYQKSPGDLALKRIGHIYYGSYDYEESFKEHVTFAGDLSEGTVKNGSSLNNQVKQTPKDIYQTKETSPAIQCSHNIDNYDRILWYKQQNDGQLQFLGSSLNNQVKQTPKDIYQTKETSPEIQCSHSIDSYNMILWYKQLSDGQLQLLGYMLGTSQFLEKGVKVQMTGDANKDKIATLTIEEPSSAVYYCAASLTVKQTPKDIYKTKETSPEIQCSHSIDNYDQILWYKQLSSSLNNQVKQTPKDIYQTKETSPEIQCSHKIDSYNMILWYKQLSDGQLQLLGYMVGTSQYPEKGMKVQMTGDANKDKIATLTIEEPSSAVYYCAASLTVKQTPKDIYQTKETSPEIQCSHSIDGYSTILWYKQLSDGQLQLLGYMVGTSQYPEKGVKVQMTGDANKDKIATLTIEEPSSSSLNDHVKQTPKDIYQIKETSPEIKCSHSIDSFNRILWYKQLSDGQLQLLGYMLGTSQNIEKGVKVQMTGDANKDKIATLTIEEPSSAVYYCAASLTSPSSVYKNPGEQVQLVCSHEKSDYYMMHWYQKSHGDFALKRVGHINYGSYDYEEAFKEHIRFAGDLSKVKNGQTDSKGHLPDKRTNPEIQCSHNINGYNTILWYKQQDDGQLQLLGYLVGTFPNPEKGVKVQMTGDANKDKTATLTIEEPSIHQSPSFVYKNPGEQVQLVCSHEKTDYTLMYWYQKSPGDLAMKRIGHINYGSYDYDESFKEHSPLDVLAETGAKVHLLCSHNRSDYRVMLWYRRKPGNTALDLIGYGYNEFNADSMEKNFKEDFTVAGDLKANVKNGSLLIANADAEKHTAMYFCAAREAQCLNRATVKAENLCLI
ncbi:hypothetical protein WMY93_016747 [Mugilogobius chulae]|uniref:Immunoglobulin V-set domain-containing protein n=1 Tax=Mugilogobius chulae TaxID=88201 RepID=A0AAW0NL54_9GOBI